LIGRVVNDRFKIAALIARGGMGKVYRAEQAPLGRLCALKILNPNYAGDSDPEFHRRFFLEASIASKLTHPNTVTIFDYGRTDDDIYYMAMEYLEGVTLHKALRQSGPFSEERASHVARQICRALREAHSFSVIHRDLKPANIFLTEHGDEKDFVKVLDFGLVKAIGENKGEDLTQTGLFMGSPKYMAPEQIRGDRVDARTDIYALGVIMYEMLTGKVPFDRPNSVNILMAHVNEEVPPMRVMLPTIQISLSLEETVLRCMSKDPDQRFSSMDEVLAALKRTTGGALTATFSGLATGEYRVGALSLPPPSTQLMPRTALSDAPALFTQEATQGALPPVSGESPVVTPASLKPNGASKFLVGALLVGGVTLFAGGTVLSRLMQRGDQSLAKPSLRVPSIPTSPTSALLPPVEPKGEPLVLRVRLSSEPEGAIVREEGVEVCNATPCELAYTDAAATREHKVTVQKLGFKPETKSFMPDAKNVRVKLVRELRVYVAQPPASQVKEPGVPPGYKPEVPY
jgi:serine/threonine-protein kinase